MNIIQFNEIIELLHSISDNSTANIIALVSVIISGIAVLSSIYFSVQTRKQYIDSLSPLLSFRLYEKSGYLFLRIENTGQSEATEISLTFKELSNNGEQNKFELDEILKCIFHLSSASFPEIQSTQIRYFRAGISAL